MTALVLGLAAIFTSAVPSSADDGERVAASVAFEQMAHDACQRVHGADRVAVDACLAQHFLPPAPNDADLAEPGDDEDGFADLDDLDDLACIEVGGVLRRAMPACVDALAQMVALDGERQSRSEAFFASLVEVTVACSSRSLCGLEGESFRF